MNQSKVNVDMSYDSVDITPSQSTDISPFDVIKSLAEKLGQIITDPKSNCKKCNGRGYIGRDYNSKAPIPCPCIYPNYNSSENINMINKMRKPSRSERRKQDREYKNMIKRGLRK